MKATVWIVLTAAPVLWATAAGATGRVTIQTALNVATAPVEPAGVQLAAGWQASSETSAEKRRLQASDHDVDLDQYPTDSHRKLMPGQKAGINVTGSPSGYDAKASTGCGAASTAPTRTPKQLSHTSPMEGMPRYVPAGGHVDSDSRQQMDRQQTDLWC